MGKPALNSDIVELWSNRAWRINNLYWIEDKFGNVVKFAPNVSQAELLEEMHFLNIILKARQMGFSTFILILALDCVLFNSNFAAGLIADTLDNAKNLLKRIKFAYDRLPGEIKAARPIEASNATELLLVNGSSVEVGVSLRSTTKNFLHISEYGKICAKNPEKAKEVKSGALNTLAPKQLCFIESTAEGRGGDFYDKTQQAMRLGGLGDMDYKFHFFPWYRDATYVLDTAQKLTIENEDYFDGLKSEHGIELTPGQKNWYAAKLKEQGDDMWKEYPSTAEEAFLGAKDGAYFAKALRGLRQRKMIGEFGFESRTPVNTFWDLGVHDSTSIWLHQLIGGKHRFVGYYENSGEGIAHYIDWLNKWAVRHSAVFGEHYGPHDVDHRKMGVTAQSVRDIARGLGFAFSVVERTPDKLSSIQNVRTKLPECEFDESACDEGLLHLESYSRDWDDKYSVWKSHPRHDEHSHCADAFMTFADGFIPPSTPKLKRRRKDSTWMSSM